MGWVYDDPEKEANFWRIVACAIGAAALIVIPVTWYGILDQRDNTDRIIETLKKEKAFAEERTARASQELERERAINQAVAKINLDAFLYQYNRLLTELKDATDRYQAAKRLPPSDRGPSVANAKRQLYIASDTLLTFLARWRAVAESLNELLDGNVTRMDQARQSDNPDDVENAVQILIRTFPALRDQLQIKINVIKTAN
jgi:hypothetical protein